MDYKEIILDYTDYLKKIELDKKLAIQIVSLGAIGVAVIYLGKIWRSYGFFEKRGIKTPPYRFFYGNLPQIRKEGFSQTLVNWTKKYGKTYGYYEGHMPVMVTSDLEIIDEIFYKQFMNFTGRRILPFQVSDTDELVNAFSAARNRWKRLRAIINPVFSPSKLKELLPSMKICSDRFINVIENNLDTKMDVTEYLDRLTMDAVWKSIFGIDVDMQSNPNLVYFVKAKEITDGFADFNGYFLAITYFYELRPFIIPILNLYSILINKLNENLGSPFFWLIYKAQEILDQKLASKTHQKHDFISMLLELQSKDLNLEFDKQQYDSTTANMIEKKITNQEIISNVIGFIFAGFDTTASTLAFCFYVLINHPEEMAKLQEELDSMNTTDITYEKLNEFHYLDMFVKEVMRMYPVGNVVVTRRCTQATKVKGIEIPEDLLIVADVLSLHYDQAYWGDVDTNEFYPQRFADNSKVNKLAYMPFGAGSRTCIGMKFALMEIKITLAKVLMKYNVLPGSSNPKDLVTREATFTVRRPKHGISVIFKKRT